MEYRQNSSSNTQQAPEQPRVNVPNWATWKATGHANRYYERMIEHAMRESERELEREGYRSEDHGPQMPAGSDGEDTSDMDPRSEDHEQENMVDEQEANGDAYAHEQVEEDYASCDDDHYADDDNADDDYYSDGSY
ncbi:hypothetical protein IW146_007502 [Coemansia sp. RSA 922]|nr:hypothetical protein H4S04_001319 [Coemansia sp. S16]KAJ2071557.1 hypothetical protein GGH13_003278 [Coemansia sp. S155-1]KAJ2107046.1 hypothetical protein IW146_007502 [Coemansia sp. RSA 922]